jgi:hypothetical protein
LLKNAAWLLGATCLATSLWIGGRQPGCDVYFALLGAVWLGIARRAGTLAPKNEAPAARRLEAYQPSATWLTRW